MTTESKNIAPTNSISPKIRLIISLVGLIIAILVQGSIWFLDNKVQTVEANLSLTQKLLSEIKTSSNQFSTDFIAYKEAAAQINSEIDSHKLHMAGPTEKKSPVSTNKAYSEPTQQQELKPDSDQLKVPDEKTSPPVSNTLLPTLAKGQSEPYRGLIINNLGVVSESSANDNLPNNTFIGQQENISKTSGTDNVYIGYNQSKGSQHGNRSPIIGSNLGFESINGQGNTLLGVGAVGSGVGLSNATAIGANARVMNSNAMVLGNNMNVGIGTSIPQNRLELTAGTDGRSGLRLTNMTARSSTNDTTASKFLTVNDKGDVILSGTGGKYTPHLTDSYWPNEIATNINELLEFNNSSSFLTVDKKGDVYLVKKEKIDANKLSYYSKLYPVFRVNSYTTEPIPKGIKLKKSLAISPSLLEQNKKLQERIEELTTQLADQQRVSNKENGGLLKSKNPQANN